MHSITEHIHKDVYLSLIWDLLAFLMIIVSTDTSVSAVYTHVQTRFPSEGLL